MRRLFVAFVPVAFAFILATTAPAAPVPKHLIQDPVYYFPTKAGAKWVYDQGNGECVLIVSKVEAREGVKVVSVESVEGNQKFPFETIEVSASGLVRTRCRAGELDPPSVLLKVPFKPRDSWDFDEPGSEIVGPQKGTCVVDTDSIRVPAGTFTTARVDRKCLVKLGGEQVYTKTSSWYAPNVGLVKMTDDKGKNIWVLRSFTPGKE